MKKLSQNIYTLKFKDKDLEKEYIAFHKKSTYKHTRNAMILGLIIFYISHFIDSQILANFHSQIDTKKTIIEKIINENLLVDNSITDSFTKKFENILLQDKKFSSKMESYIWKIRFNILFLGIVIFFISGMSRFSKYQEYAAVSMGVFGSIGISVMISYVNGLAAYIYLVALLLIIVWMAVITRVRYIIALIAILMIIGFNNLITSNIMA